MAETVPITFAFYGFEPEIEPPLLSAFAQSEHWSPPWKRSNSIENARVIICNIEPENGFEQLDELRNEFPRAIVVTFSTIKPPRSEWHLERQPNGTASILKFSQLVLKISNTLKKENGGIGISQPASLPTIDESHATTEPSIADNANQNRGIDDTDSTLFFEHLDFLLEKKMIEKRKRFNEKS